MFSIFQSYQYVVLFILQQQLKEQSPSLNKKPSFTQIGYKSISDIHVFWVHVHTLFSYKVIIGLYHCIQFVEFLIDTRMYHK